MKKKWLLLCVMALAAMMALCACGSSSGGDEPAGGEEEATTASVTNDGMTLSYPKEYEDLMVFEVPEDDKDGVLFVVSEEASVAAAEKQDQDTDGAGWLFSIGRVSEDKMHEMLTQDMSGAEVFAKSDDGTYYVYYHPTDVRMIREDNEAMEADQDKWTEYNEWAATVPDTFLKENGLTEEKHTNTDLDIDLARIAYGGEKNYTITRLDPEPLKPGKVDPLEYVEPLINGVTYEEADLKEVPDGEYIVLLFPKDKVRYDFFVADGNYVREVRGDNETLYKATFTDDSLKTGDLMQKWHDALVK